MLLPRGPVAFPAVRRVVIAWDASVEASKAVRDAIGLMRQAEETHAVLIDPVPSFEGHGPAPGADLATYLGRHGISVTVHRLPREGREVAHILQRTAVDLARRPDRDGRLRPFAAAPAHLRRHHDLDAARDEDAGADGALMITA